MKRKQILAFAACCLAAGASGQTLAQAKQWFESGNFAAAKPVFQKLVRQAPANASYNFWYGACCYETGEPATAQPYLEKAAQRQVINAYLYLGKLYYSQYRFDEAVENLEEHLSWLQKKKRDTAAAEEELNRCRRAARMIKGTEKIAVIDSFVVDKQKLIDTYRLSKEAGKIAPSDDGSGSSFTNEMGDKKFSTVRTGDGRTVLVSQIKLINRWSNPEPIASLNETADNLTHPFMDSDGITLYFASDSDEGLGGYDLFVTRYDTDDNTYLRPDNLGMPFNSPANDYLFAIDDFNNLGWFASDRYQPEGKVRVYVFAPNESKVTYDYEMTDPDVMSQVASLRAIRSTWSNPDKVRIAKQQLAQVLYSTDEQQAKADFHFVINDRSVYTQQADFRSKEAGDLFRQLRQQQHDLATLEEQLAQLRSQYASSDPNAKARLAGGILDQEKRVLQLRHEVEALTLQIRNKENETIR